MWCQPHDSLITFNNGLGPLKTKSGGGFHGGGRVGRYDGRGFCLEGSYTHFQKAVKLSCGWYHMVESRSLNGPLKNDVFTFVWLLTYSLARMILYFTCLALRSLRLYIIMFLQVRWRKGIRRKKGENVIYEQKTQKERQAGGGEKKWRK